MRIAKETGLGGASRRIFEGGNGDFGGKDTFSRGQYSRTRNPGLVLTRIKVILSNMYSKKERML